MEEIESVVTEGNMTYYFILAGKTRICGKCYLLVTPQHMQDHAQWHEDGAH